MASLLQTPKTDAPQTDARQLDWSGSAAVLPLVAGVGMFLLGYFFYRFFIGCSAAPWLVSHCPSLQGTAFLTERPTFDPVEFTARAKWGATVVLSTLSALAALSIAAGIARRYVRLSYPFAWVHLASVAVVLLFYLLPTSWFSTPFRGLVVPTVGKAMDPYWIQAVTNGLPLGAGVCLALAVGAVLLKPTQVVTVEVALADQTRYLQILLVSSAVVLITGMLSLGALLSWPSAYVNPALPGAETVVKQIDAVSAAFTTLNGTFYSALLASVFVPAWLVVRSRAFAYAKKQNPNDSRYKLQVFLEGKKIEVSPWSRVGNVLAILGPFLVSVPISAIASALAF